MTDRQNYTNAMMDAVCFALEDFDLSDFQIRNLAADLPREYLGYMADKADLDAMDYLKFEDMSADAREESYQWRHGEPGAEDC